MKSIVHQCLHEALVTMTANPVLPRLVRGIQTSSYIHGSHGQAAGRQGCEVRIQLDYPTSPKHGDVSTNLAFILAKRCGIAPQVLSEQLLSNIPPHPSIERVECAGGGFLNFFFKREALLAVVEEMFVQSDTLIGDDNTDPLIQYAITRTDTILHQLTQQGLFCHEKTGKIPFNRLQTVQEHVLIVWVNRYHDAAQQFDASAMAVYLQQLANALHLYYNTVTLLCADEELREAQLGLLKTVSFVLKKGMKLLGESRSESK